MLVWEDMTLPVVFRTISRCTSKERIVEEDKGLSHEIILQCSIVDGRSWNVSSNSDCATFGTICFSLQL